MQISKFNAQTTMANNRQKANNQQKVNSQPAFGAMSSGTYDVLTEFIKATSDKQLALKTMRKFNKIVKQMEKVTSRILHHHTV